MVNFNPILSLLIIIGVLQVWKNEQSDDRSILYIQTLILQVCTAKAIAIGKENDVTQLFTADELERARKVGLKDQHLITGLSRGVTAEEMIQITILSNLEKGETVNDTATNITNFEKMVCITKYPNN